MRRLVFILGICAVVLLAIVLSAPWWLGPALIKIGPRYGLTVESYERIGYARFAVRGVEYRRDPVVVKVQHAEAETPFLWLWRRGLGTPGMVKGGEWSVDVISSERKTASTSPRGWVPLQARLAKIAHHLASWVPHVEAGKGVVRWPKGELTLSSGLWQNRKVSTPDLGYRALHAAVTGEFPVTGPIEVSAKMLDGSAEAVIQGDGPKMKGHGTWWGQPADLVADFNEQGWLPREASLTAKEWEVAGEKVKLEKHYALVRGNAAVDWRDGRLNANISMDSEPVENTEAPPLSIKVRGHGNNDAFVAESLDVSIPGVEAHLSAPVAIDLKGRIHSEPSTFTLVADLAGQPWFPARGNLRGSGKISAGRDGFVLIDFFAAGEDVAVADIAVSRVKADGQLAWPELMLRDGVISTPDGSELAWQGGANFRSRELLDTAVSGRIVRSLLMRWLPEYPKFGALQIDAKAHGPWANAKHEGRVEVADLQFQQTNPLAVKLNWKGDGLAFDRFTSEARAGTTTLTAEGAVDRESLRLTALTFSNGEEMRLQLTKPTELYWAPTFRVSNLDLSGPHASVRAELAWGETGRIQFRAQHVSSEWFRPVFTLPPTQIGVDLLEADGSWEGGPAEFLVNAAVTVHLGKDRAAQVSAGLKGSADAVEITSLRIAEAGAVIVNATGRVPLSLRPGAKQKWEMADDAPFTFDAATSSNPGFWQEITQLTGVEIVEPEVSLHLYGTLDQPRGEARLSAARVAPVQGRFKGVWPKIEALKLRALADNARVNLEEFALSVEGQAVRVSGQLPLTFKDWREVTKDPVAFVQQGEIRVEVPDAEVAAFVHYFPEYIAPKGRFQVDLMFQGEQALVGFIRLQDGTSRPLGPLGVLQEINADIRFNERTANFQAVTARMGGQLVKLQGRAQLPVNRAPQLDLTLTGENLPFVRRSGLLIRGDLDLQLTTPASGIPVIQGNVGFRDSLFLADIRSLIPSGGAKGVAARPPYFALETPPLNAWGLNIKVEGDRFLRLRTPVFNGVASTRFELSGTLGEPQIAGEALIDEGNIRLPFASFEVRQGEIRLSRGQIEPQLYLAATTRRYGYDLRMELSGDASAPKLVFSSSPPLEAEQVLLMVMAGEAPSNEISTTDRQRVARFGAFFGQSLLGSLGGDPTGPERLTISSGGDISEQGRETYSIEYKLANRWALTGEYDEFDDYYGGVKWRLFPKKDKEDEEN
jgi:translocation and assembly module TamB